MTLTHLDLHCSTANNITPWQWTCRELVKSVASNLQHLKLAFWCNTTPQYTRWEDSLAVIIGGATFPKLEDLELRALPPTWRRCTKEREHMPLLQDFDITSFVKEHSIAFGNLRILSSFNVLVASVSVGVSDERLLGNMREVLESANVKFEWTGEEF